MASRKRGGCRGGGYPKPLLGAVVLCLFSWCNKNQPRAATNTHKKKLTAASGNRRWPKKARPPQPKRSVTDRSTDRLLSASLPTREIYLSGIFFCSISSLFFFRRPQSRKTLHRIMCSIKCLFPFVAIFLPTLPGLCTLWVNFKVRTLKFRFFPMDAQHDCHQLDIFWISISL